jgi:mRNA interferase RelE/StbE
VSYTILIKKKAEKELLRLQQDDVIKISTAINLLAENPRPHGSKKLIGSTNEYRIRVGDYRILYTINDTIITIYIFKIAHRKEAYTSK